MAASTEHEITTPGAHLTWRRTPWDERSLGVPTAEITSLTHQGLESAALALRAFHEALEAGALGLATTRFPADDLVLKLTFARAGWHNVETSQVVTLEGLARHDFAKVFRRVLPLEAPAEADFDAIREIARTSFRYSRFDEDLRIDRERCRRRYELWIDDLRAQGKRFLVHRAGGSVIAFMAFSEVPGRTVDLVLGGSAERASWVSPLFWASLMEALKQEGRHGVVRARVSAANVGVLRLYESLGFKVKHTDLGYSWLRSGDSHGP